MLPIIIANWKMNLNVAASAVLAKNLAKKLKRISGREVALCPSFSALYAVGEILKRSRLKLGVQDLFWENVGAYTGEESPKFLRQLGCCYAIVGHSERRQNFKETDGQVRQKIKSALANDLTPILCVGETFSERQEGRTDSIIMNQVIQALAGVDLIPSEHLVIAYEPVWVIGSGQAIEPSEAENAFKIIRQSLIDLWPLTIVKNNVRIIYGGSIDATNVKDFTTLDYFAGFLVGGASLDENEFVKIIESC